MRLSHMNRNQQDISSYYSQLQESARSDVLHESEEQILGTETNDLAMFFYEKYAITPIEIDVEREVSWDPQDYFETIPAHQREEFCRSDGDLRDFPCQRVVVEVPVVQNKHLAVIAHLQASTHSLGYSDRDFTWGTDLVSRSFETKGYQLNLDEQQIEREVKSLLQSIQDTIRWKNESISRGNQELLVRIKQVIEERKQHLLQNKEKLASLTKTIDIPLKKKVAVGAQMVRVAHTPLVQRVKPKPTLPEEYILDEARVNDIVTLLDNQAKNFEQTPKAFKTLDEEDLRDVLLSNLNSVFEGNATGETFSKQGKTDIYLNIAKGHILICECKIWGGQALYVDTIDQLRNYLTWRHNFGIMITFVRIKDFTKTLRESESTIQAHSSYLNGFKKINDTHFVSNHKVNDDEKEVRVHHLFFHLFTEKV